MGCRNMERFSFEEKDDVFYDGENDQIVVGLGLHIFCN